MPNMTLLRLSLITVVICLGVTVSAVVKASQILDCKSSILGLFSANVSETARPNPTRAHPSENAGHGFGDRTPFPYMSVTGPIHGSPDLEYEY